MWFEPEHCLGQQSSASPTLRHRNPLGVILQHQLIRRDNETIDFTPELKNRHPIEKIVPMSQHSEGEQTLKPAKPPPPLNIPESKNIVKLSVIDA